MYQEHAGNALPASISVLDCLCTKMWNYAGSDAEAISHPYRVLLDASPGTYLRDSGGQVGTNTVSGIIDDVVIHIEMTLFADPEEETTPPFTQVANV